MCSNTGSQCVTGNGLTISHLVNLKLLLGSLHVKVPCRFHCRLCTMFYGFWEDTLKLGYSLFLPVLPQPCSEVLSRMEPNRCKEWFKIAKNAPVDEKWAECVRCSSCKKLLHDPERSRRRAIAVSPSKGGFYHYAMNFLSPLSQQKRTDIASVSVEKRDAFWRNVHLMR